MRGVGHLGHAPLRRERSRSRYSDVGYVSSTVSSDPESTHFFSTLIPRRAIEYLKSPFNYSRNKYPKSIKNGYAQVLSIFVRLSKRFGFDFLWGTAVYVCFLIIQLCKQLYGAFYEEQILNKLLSEANDYEKWYEYAEKLDQLREVDSWRKSVQSINHFDYELIQRRLYQLKNLRRDFNVKQIAFVLRAGLHRNLGG
jgi:hypothetical protein